MPLVHASSGSPNANRRGRGWMRGTFLALAWATGAIAVSHAVQPDPLVERLLTETMGFSTSDLSNLERGSAFIRSLDTPVREELAHDRLLNVACAMLRDGACFDPHRVGITAT